MMSSYVQSRMTIVANFNCETVDSRVEYSDSREEYSDSGEEYSDSTEEYSDSTEEYSDSTEEYSDRGCLTQGSLLNSDLLKCLNPSDEPSCSSQQEPMSTEYNQRNNFAIYNMDAPKGHKLMLCNPEFKKTSTKQQKVDLQTKFNEIKQDCFKSPISKLNEIMLLKKQVVEYKLISIAGHVHNPTFRFIAENDELHAYGEGLSKKEAKKNAAIAFLDKLDNCNGNSTITSSTLNISPSKVSPLKYSKESVLDEISKVNPIGVLQELCIARRWKLPDYEFSHDERNEAHNAWYSVVCSVKNLQSKGEGKTKQTAKRQAAHIMYDQIKSVSQQSIPKEYRIPSQFMLDLEENTDFDSIDNLKSSEIFLNDLKKSKKPSIRKLRNCDSITEVRKNSIEFLSAIGKEEHFSVTYVLVTRKSTHIDMLVQLGVTPILFFIGTGRSTAEAQEMAAYVALSSIKLLLEE